MHDAETSGGLTPCGPACHTLVWKQVTLFYSGQAHCLG